MKTTCIMEQLKELYYDAESGFTSADKFYKRAREEDIPVTLKQVKEFLAKQETAQLNKQVKKPDNYRQILAEGPGSNYQLDIIVYDRYEFNTCRKNHILV
jgi:hypothetical protein